ncbi:hypothetical protein DPM13_00550 [Paracoccus mutanolyticus]|uniref:Uncharacterized protein n=1 Tax=Paracoccus mutanolyticus TaxID=1499308 RepID=A0ABM6WNT7_9RHOB|nr:hypothetical protein [Paracoccus mutanolyticus]AWX92291.1 hypothetical protein DPM13_00550 [Paracoccus mutanolyticus]
MHLVNSTFDELQPGDSAELRRLITPDDLYVFAAASGNYNPMPGRKTAEGRVRKIESDSGEQLDDQAKAGIEEPQRSCRKQDGRPKPG